MPSIILLKLVKFKKPRPIDIESRVEIST
jgi:hypothetical protein